MEPSSSDRRRIRLRPGCLEYPNLSKKGGKTNGTAERSLSNHSASETFTPQPTGRRAFPFFPPHPDDVSNWPFLFPFPSSFIILSSPAPLRGSPSFVLVFEFSLADRLSQIISFNSPCGTKTHSPCNFLIILFPFEAPECRLVRCQFSVPSAGGGNVFRRTLTGLFSRIKGN